MKYARIGELRDGLSRYIDQVREGSEILVLDRDRPVARIVPAGGPHPRPVGTRSGSSTWSGAASCAAGRDATRAVLKRGRPVKVRGSVLADLRAERESGW